MNEGLSFITKLQYLTNVVVLLAHKINVTVRFGHTVSFITGLCLGPLLAPTTKAEILIENPPVSLSGSSFTERAVHLGAE